MTLPPQQRRDAEDSEPEREPLEGPESEECPLEESAGREMDIFAFHVGQHIDVLDSSDRWSEAEVLKIDRENNRIFVTFLYWQSKWDTWVDNILERTAPLHTHTYYPSGPLRLGQRVCVRDRVGKWLEAFIVEEYRHEVKVHFFNFSPTFDEVIPRSHTHRFRQFGPHKKLQKSKQWSVPYIRESDRDVDMLIAHNEAKQQQRQQCDRPGSSSSQRMEGGIKMSPRESKHVKAANIALENERQREIIEFSERYDHYIQALREQQLEVYPVEGDGNCLFRAVAHQVYGDERYHDIVREKCMDYMETQAEFYCQFVVGGMQMFPLYVAAKRQNGCWGDDPEIQALCEMYDRPAYIWAYDAQRGAKNLRTFHEAARVHSRGGCSRGVIRLSYYGGGHYDSIHKVGTFDRGLYTSNNQEKMSSRGLDDVFIQSLPGILEDRAIQRVSQRQSEALLPPQSSTPGQTQASHDGDRNWVLERELEQVAEAKRLSEKAASDMDLDIAIRASRRDMAYWEDEDVEACLQQSLCMAKAEDKGTSPSANSRPGSKCSPRKHSSSQDSVGGVTVDQSPHSEASTKRQRMHDSSISSTSQYNSDVKSCVKETENEILAESLRDYEEMQLKTATVISDEEALVQDAIKASLDETLQQQYDTIIDSQMCSTDTDVQLGGDDDDALQKALALSIDTSVKEKGIDVSTAATDEELDFQNALHMSLQGATTTVSELKSNSHPSLQALTSSTNAATSDLSEENNAVQYSNSFMFDDEEDPELALALQFSMQDR